ncbi:regulator of G-protein signaling 3-like isoform X2 [Archocentrus centrarchus]|uniref:regulator of G-protein signaling 3-like isoform X2 n=1 Tax=Archocentrus centrarchus TaxID=63155 RepID=UPI0011EA1A40|nr:regulator of G-protein signaling 3-like isoform X2 [Archocentrus centrarchus]
MDSASVCSRKRHCDGAVLRLHQEAQQPANCKRRFREEEVEMKKRRKRRISCKENRDPEDNLQRERRHQRGVHQTGSGFRSGGEIQSCRPEVRVALIRKTRIQTGVKTLVQLRESDPIQALTDPQRDQKSAQNRRVRTPSKVRSRPSSVGRIPETGTRRKRKVHPSAFRGRGQLRLSVTVEVEQVIIHIHEARGLMGKSQRSCDSYVKLALTSDYNHRIRMKTQTVLDNKNPKYERRFTLCVGDELLLSRLLVSVFRRQADSRCSRLIGCMSFGIGSLISSCEPLTGWFYLLGEEYGRSKYLRVTSQGRGPVRRCEEVPVEMRDLRRTPDSTPDSDLNRDIDVASTSVSTAILTKSTSTTSTTAPKDLTTSLDPAKASYSGYVSTLYTNTNQHHASRDGSCAQQMTVSIARGKDGFGFTICSDCPVRVQAVDAGGPAQQSGLRQGDSVLQLNGLPVETWKCVDLAHAIRSCQSQIVLVVWRGLPEVRSACEAMLRPHTHNTTTGRKLLSHPTHSKHGRKWGQGSGVRSSLGALGSLWRDRKEDREEEEEDEEDQEVYTPHTTTLKGTRVTSSNGDNYIILSPVNPGGQLMQPVYQDRNGTIGRLYQTHPSRGQNLLHDPRSGSSQRPFSSHTSTLPPPLSSTSSSSTLPRNYGNYQNCTMVQSHVPCSGYGTYVTLAPKTVIFPIFVQPLDLCSPDRTLLMSEEMILHQANLLPAKVTVLIYSDLLLLTREDEAGRCNVLQSPVYLNTLQLREALSEPLHLYFLHSSQGCCRCLFSLEAFSIEQKVRVSLCLHDNIQLQLISTETTHTQQFSDLPSDFGLLSLRQSDLLYRPSSPYSSLCDPLRPPSPSPYSPSAPFSSSTPPPAPVPLLSPYTTSSPPPRTVISPAQLLSPPQYPSSTLRSPIWKERAGAEEEEERRKRQRGEEEVEERQQGEGESASETSENVGGVRGRGFLLSHHHFDMNQEKDEDSDDEEEEEEGTNEFTYRPTVLRRSLSEGSLLQEPRSPRFLSDSTIHRLTRTVNFDFNSSSNLTSQAPSPHTLRKQLTKEGGSLHQMLMLLNMTKAGESRNHQLKKKTQNLAADVRGRLAFLRRRKNSTGVRGNSLEKALRNNRPSAGEVLRWAESLEALLSNQYGLTVFRHFLRSEFSEENLDFWLAVERFKRTRPSSKMAARAAKIYDQFISTTAARQVNMDSAIREATNQSMRLGISSASFQLAQDQIFYLMETDSYPRFLKSRFYTQLASQNTETATELANETDGTGRG